MSASTVDFETIWIEIHNPKAKNILRCCAYRHPSSDIAKFTDHMQETLSIVNDENKLAHIMGDFINMMFSLHSMPSVLHPTRITDSCSTLIDNIFLSNIIDSCIISCNLLSIISVHLPQFAVLKDKAPKYKNKSHFEYDYRTFDKTKFLSDYSDIERSYLSDESTDLNTKFDKFLRSLHDLINKHCPKKKLSKKVLKLRSKPWINFQIQKMMRIRDKIFKLSESSTDEKACTHCRNRVVNEIKESKKKYYHHYFDKNKSNMKML